MYRGLLVKTSKCSIVAVGKSLKAKSSKGASRIVSGGPAWYWLVDHYWQKHSTEHTLAFNIWVLDGSKPKMFHHPEKKPINQEAHPPKLLINQPNDPTD